MSRADRFDRSVETIAQTEEVVEGMELMIELNRRLLDRSRELIRKIEAMLRRK